MPFGDWVPAQSGKNVYVVGELRPYRDRSEAGQRLAAELSEFRSRPDVLVLALPRGGVPVGYEVAHGLSAPLDVLVVRKLGLPFQPELAMGAIASGGVRILNHEVVDTLGIPSKVIDTVAAQELSELERREHQYRGRRQAADPQGRTAILIDDGLATGSSMRAAIAAVRQRGAASVVVAVPVGARSTCQEIARLAHRFVCPLQPPMFMAVGEWYDDFDQVSDEEVRLLLESAPAASPIHG